LVENPFRDQPRVEFMTLPAAVGTPDIGHDRRYGPRLDRRLYGSNRTGRATDGACAAPRYRVAP
jgi:hypothetical protein